MGKLLVCGLTALLMVLMPLSGISLLKEDHRPLTPVGLAAAEDLDPLVDIAVTVEIQKIRSLESDTLLGAPLDKIDVASDPDFY
ncbi:MAG: hypothetical protein ACP5EK_06885, partial [Thermoplasmatota archaeon]